MPQKRKFKTVTIDGFFLFLVALGTSGNHNAPAHGVSPKSDDPRLSHCDWKTILLLWLPSAILYLIRNGF